MAYNFRGFMDPLENLTFDKLPCGLMETRLRIPFHRNPLPIWIDPIFKGKRRKIIIWGITFSWKKND